MLLTNAWYKTRCACGSALRCGVLQSLCDGCGDVDGDGSLMDDAQLNA